MSSKIIKGLVSKKKKRYQKDGFDLDLSYICGNVIAMGFPSENIQAFYRNNIDEVSRFLEYKHPERYKIYNLCSERSYDPQKFRGRVAHFPFKDHNPPNLSIIPQFCSDVQGWLDSNSENVAVVHCKAGKGRTGLMICCYLLHSKQVSTANDAMCFYAKERTHDAKGVTIPSQRRYVEYYEKILKSPGMQYVNRAVLLLQLTLEGMINITGSTRTIYISITQSGTEDYKYCSEQGGIEWKKTGAPFTIVLSQPLVLDGDIKVELCVKNMMTKQKLCHFWFNTFFIDKDSNSKTNEFSPAPDNNHTTVRFSSHETSAVRNSSDNVRELERTTSCPAPVELLRRSPIPDQWMRHENKFSEGIRKSPRPSAHLCFQKSHLDKANMNLIPKKSNFGITLSFSTHPDSDDPDGRTTVPPRCFRSQSDTNPTSTHPTPPSHHPRYSSSSSSSSSCTDDDQSSEGSADSTGALLLEGCSGRIGRSGSGKHYKL